MKAVIVHSNAAAIEKDWANQFAGLDAAVKADFASVVDWQERVNRVFTIGAITWSGIVEAVSKAAAAAGSGGVVVIASGHGGSVPGDDSAGIVNWDASDGDVARDWSAAKVAKGLFWDEVIMGYTDPIPNGNPPTRKAEDEQAVRQKKSNAAMAQKRLDAFDALMKIKQALTSNSVKRLTFTVCTAGRATKFMDRMAKHLQTDVACFKSKTLVFDDATFKFKPGKARLVMESDKAKDGVGTNTREARVFSPNLDNPALAYVAKKP
ncbi:hypothetical protein HNQ60_002625 [Povalibacter uvarum]|uniref:Uncharacterized protein n=1 Tax=Povalibacter uvarum TaxID=732238 RepID=A0A841HMB5_9GAMM|nr:hypothetical protein [Povalibacter uvarum]MBB6093744.1 hypothetical protein [Povalibacter uvarum]